MSVSGFAVYGTHKLASVIIFSYGSFWSQKKCVFGLYNLRENATGFGQDNNMMFKILLFCSPFPFALFSSFLYHNKLILSKMQTKNEINVFKIKC